MAFWLASLYGKQEGKNKKGATEDGKEKLDSVVVQWFLPKKEAIREMWWVLGGIFLLFLLWLVFRGREEDYYEEEEYEEYEGEEYVDYDEEEEYVEKPRRIKRSRRIKSGYDPELDAFIDVSETFPKK